MKNLPRISDSEWQVMKVLWVRSPLSAGEIVAGLSGAGWKPKTIQTLLGRLVRKEAVGFEAAGRVYLYRPLVSQRQCVRAESRSFLQRVYGGAVGPMLATFIESEKLSPDEIADLKRILNRKEGEHE